MNSKTIVLPVSYGWKISFLSQIAENLAPMRYIKIKATK
jgi:hypothetical protein